MRVQLESTRKYGQEEEGEGGGKILLEMQVKWLTKERREFVTVFECSPKNLTYEPR